MNGDLPPSSSDSFLPVPAVALRIARPTSVEPVKAILSTPAMGDERRAGRAVAGDDVDDARRQPRLDADLGEGERGQRRVFGRLQHDRVAGGERRRDLPGEHQQREVPRDDLPADADRPRARETRSRSARPSRRDDRNGGRRAECRCRAIRGSACRCRSSPAPRGSARASARGARAHRDASPARGRRAPPISACALRAAATAASTSAGEPCVARGEPLAGRGVEDVEQRRRAW